MREIKKAGETNDLDGFITRLQERLAHVGLDPEIPSDTIQLSGPVLHGNTLGVQIPPAAVAKEPLVPPGLAYSTRTRPPTEGDPPDADGFWDGYDTVQEARTAWETDPPQPYRLPKSAPTPPSVVSAKGGGKFTRLAQELPPVEEHDYTGHAHDHPHFRTYMNQGVPCPDCGEKMIASGQGNQWGWHCPKHGWKLHGPNHYESTLDPE